MSKHHITTLCALVALSLMPHPTWAQEQKETTPTEEAPQLKGEALAEHIFAKHNLGTTEGCLKFDEKKLLARKALWKDAIWELSTQDPDYLHAWLVGQQEPPKTAIQEAISQRDCMFGQLVADAALPDNDLILNYGDKYRQSKHTMEKVAKKYEKSSQFRKEVAHMFSQSHYRDAAGQAYIWYRKFYFKHPRSFNLVSNQAAEKCGFTPGVSWKPKNTRHQRCWNDHLTKDERQREILTASSAPGISRHHWGTEFDLYGLNPRRFMEERELHDEYVWMSQNALTHGFFQPFTGPEMLGEHTYIEERWHWSYYPVAQALVSYIEEHPERYESALDALWEHFDTRWRGKKQTFSHFSYVKAHWKDYVFHTARLKLALMPSWISPSSILRIAVIT